MHHSATDMTTGLYLLCERHDASLYLWILNISQLSAITNELFWLVIDLSLYLPPHCDGVQCTVCLSVFAFSIQSSALLKFGKWHSGCGCCVAGRRVSQRDPGQLRFCFLTLIYLPGEDWMLEWLMVHNAQLWVSAVVKDCTERLNLQWRRGRGWLFIVVVTCYLTPSRLYEDQREREKKKITSKRLIPDT